MIIQIIDELDCNQCDILLTKLIQDEKQYDDTISDNFVVKNYFKNIIKLKDSILLGYKKDNKIVGYLYLKPIENHYLIDGLYVEKEYRNQSIATNLIKEAEKILKQKGIKYVNINVLNNNKLAKDIYESLEFKAFKIELRKEL